MSDETPPCPLTFRYQAGGDPCIGSRCPRWVPQLSTPEGNRPSGTGPQRAGEPGYLTATDSNYNRTDARGRATGLGWCADNLRRQPWTDPATLTNADAHAPAPAPDSE